METPACVITVKFLAICVTSDQIWIAVGVTLVIGLIIYEVYDHFFSEASKFDRKRGIK